VNTTVIVWLHKRRGISWLTEGLSVSDEWFAPLCWLILCLETLSFWLCFEMNYCNYSLPIHYVQSTGNNNCIIRLDVLWIYSRKRAMTNNYRLYSYLKINVPFLNYKHISAWWCKENSGYLLWEPEEKYVEVRQNMREDTDPGHCCQTHSRRYKMTQSWFLCKSWEPLGNALTLTGCSEQSFCNIHVLGDSCTTISVFRRRDYHYVFMVM